VASRLKDDGLVIEEELGELHRWRVLEVDEPKGREPTEAERAETATILTRPPMKSWGLTREYKPARRGGPAPS
jgi:hypothetical protein